MEGEREGRGKVRVGGKLSGGGRGIVRGSRRGRKREREREGEGSRRGVDRKRMTGNFTRRCAEGVTISNFSFADVDPLIVVLDLLQYEDGRHVLEIVGLTQVSDILRTTVEFYGLGTYVHVCVSVFAIRTKALQHCSSVVLYVLLLILQHYH